jgi:hypothetical protein
MDLDEEEIMQGINRTIAFMKEELNAEHSCFSIKELWALNGLVDLYNKEKEEKEKFKKALGKRITYCNELEKDLFENCSNYVISKDKIREKIEKLEKDYKEINQYGDFIIADTIQPRIEILKELLEE